MSATSRKIKRLFKHFPQFLYCLKFVSNDKEAAAYRKASYKDGKGNRAESKLVLT